MNTLVLICLLCIVVCNARGNQRSEATYSSEAGVTRGPASGDGLHNLLLNDDEVDEELSGGDHVILHDSHHNKDDRKRRKGKGKRKNKQKYTTPFNPEHTIFTNGYTSILTTTEDPCNSTHLGYCIHGYCKYWEGLQDPVCICMRGYDGERCGIQLLEATKPKESYNSELVQTVLVVIAVILSSISCCAILLMTCAHYRSHKNFMASYLGTGPEKEKLQKSIGDVIV